MSFEFIADRPVLDFLPTLAARGTADDEKLRSDQDLADWIAGSGLVDRVPPIGPGARQRAQDLREAMFRLVAALIDDRPADPADVRRVNAAAAKATPVPRLGGDGLHFGGDLDAVLAVLARDCLQLHAGPDRELLHWCADETCTRPFIDRSRGHRRRWCGMRGCGDRAKAAAYRERRRVSAASEGSPTLSPG